MFFVKSNRIIININSYDRAGAVCTGTGPASGTGTPGRELGITVAGEPRTHLNIK